MKNFWNILLLLIILTFIDYNFAYGQQLLNNNKTTGKIVNKGTLRIRTAGSIIGMPDTIGGRVEFVADEYSTQQIVPNVNYFQLILSGQTAKFVDSLWSNPATTIPLVVQDSFVVENNSRISITKVEVNAKSTVKNDNSGIYGTKDVRLNNDTLSQNIFGNGQFVRLNIDNPSGVDVVKNGGFKVGSKLELTRGQLRNDSTNNFTVLDSSVIIRHVGASIANEPKFEKSINVQYIGTGQLVTGPEIPTDTTVLRNLTVRTSEGIVLAKDVTVNDTLSINSNIYTERVNPNLPTDTLHQILTLTAAQNPVFVNRNAEINGSVRRTNLNYTGDTMRFNNYYTYAIFHDFASANGITSLMFRIKPKTFPYSYNNKIQRYYAISGYDVNQNQVLRGMNMKVNLGWRHNLTDTSLYETNNMEPVIYNLRLQRWSGTDWTDIASANADTNSALGWGWGNVDSVNAFGEFAIGLSGVSNFTINMKVTLEGPYRCSDMAVDLWKNNLLPTTPPNIYPYNLDPNRAFINVSPMPDSIVDWILVEFRSTLTNNNNSFYKTCLLRNDGSVVETDGKTKITVSTTSMKEGNYYMIVRHRNHLAVITANPVQVYADLLKSTLLDFSNPQLLMGNTNALKELGYNNSNVMSYGLISGFDVNSNSTIDMEDMDTFLKYMTKTGYELYDLDFNGIVNTRDLNKQWNNRGRVSFVP